MKQKQLKNKRTYGLESEKPVSNIRTGLPHVMSQTFFRRLEKAALDRGSKIHLHTSDISPEIVLGVISEDLGEQGVDNGFNLQETALPYQLSLTQLSEHAQLDAGIIQQALEKENATIINMSNHPLGKTDQKSYAKFVAPKSLYRYIQYRGYDHRVGIDAKAQNSPATGVTPDEAADALSVILAAGAAFIGIFGNSPVQEGKLCGLKESRLTMWDKWAENVMVPGDRRTVKFPAERFFTLADYFNWIYGGDSGIHFVVASDSTADYKSLGQNVLLIEGNPPVLEYLSKEKWKAHSLYDLLEGKSIKSTYVSPIAAHMEALQWTQFIGARIRFGLKSKGFPVSEFLEACKEPSKKKVESIFETHSEYMYIEGRDPGANFPDKEIIQNGGDIARSVLISPSAVQAGLIRNLPEAVKLLEKYNWKMLGHLRRAAIKDGLAGRISEISVHQFALEVLEIAGRGLSTSEQWMLAYPLWVLQTEKNGADRTIEFIHKHPKGGREAILDLVQYRKAVFE